MSSLLASIRRFFTDKHGQIVLGQRPNAPIIIWASAAVLAHLLHPGILRSGLNLIAHAALIIWAILEIYSGASYFRRTLGLVLLLATLMAILR